MFRIFKREWLILLTLACIQFIHIVDFMVMMPLGPFFLTDFHISTREFGFLISVYTISAGISGFLASFVLDRLERKKTLLTLLMGFSLGTLCCALSHHYLTLLVSRIVTGAFGGVLAALIFSILGDIVAPERRGRAMGIVMSAFSVASIVGVPFSLYLSSQLSWEAPFFLLAGLGVISCLVAFRTLPIIPPYAKHSSLSDNLWSRLVSTLSQRLNDRAQLKSLLLTSVMMLGQFSVIPLISTFLVVNGGFRMTDITLLYIVGGISAFVMSNISGRLSDRIGQKPVYVVAASCAAIPLIGITGWGSTSVGLALIFSCLLFAASSSRMVSGMSLILSAVHPQHRAGFMSLNSCVQQLFAGISAFLAGLVVTQTDTGQLLHYPILGVFAACVSLSTILIALRIYSLPQPKPMSPLVHEQELTELSDV